MGMQRYDLVTIWIERLAAAIAALLRGDGPSADVDAVLEEATGMPVTMLLGLPLPALVTLFRDDGRLPLSAIADALEATAAGPDDPRAVRAVAIRALLTDEPPVQP